MRPERYAALLMNHWHSNEKKLKADMEAASVYLRTWGKWPDDGEAYMIGWKAKAPQFAARAGPAGKPKPTTFALNKDKLLQMMAENDGRKTEEN